MHRLCRSSSTTIVKQMSRGKLYSRALKFVKFVKFVFCVISTCLENLEAVLSVLL